MDNTVSNFDFSQILIYYYISVANHGLVKKKYGNCKHNTVSMQKFIGQTRLNHWTKDKRKGENQ